MSPITKIALRRIKKSGGRSLLLAITLLFSMLIISFFVFFTLQTVTNENLEYAGLPFAEFLDLVRMCMIVTVFILFIITFFTVRNCCDLRREENKNVFAVLTSVGATNHQKKKLISTEINVLFLPPIVVGVCSGIFPGVYFGNLFSGNTEISLKNYIIYALVAIVLVAAGLLLVSVSYLLPDVSFKRRSVIQSVKKQNAEASMQSHGYRNSATFKMQDILSRLATKSVEYYGKVYNKIAVSFSNSALYPLLAVILFRKLIGTSIVLDTNPHDGVDTSAATVEAVKEILIFLGIGFLILTCVGILQSIFMTRMQFLARKESARVYLAVGMPEDDIKKMISEEMRSVLLKAVIRFTISSVVISTLFGMLLG